MFMAITGIDLFDQNASKVGKQVSQIYMNISGIDLFDQNVGMACAKIRFRCSWKSLVLIYLIKMFYGMGS